MVKVVPLDAPEPHQRRRLGFLKDRIAVPDDFDTMGDASIAAAFDGDG